MKTVLISFAVLVLNLIIYVPFSHAGWLIYHKPEFKGRVLDAETKQPIEGAVVVAIYSKKAIRWAPESVSITIKVRETLTDKNGYFRIPSYITLIDPLAWSKGVNFIIYKPGYGSFPHWRVKPPKGMDMKSTHDKLWDDFFSRQVGEIREVSVTEPWKENAKTWKEKIAFGVVELPKLITREERLRATPGHITETMDETSILNRLIEEEDKALGLK